jgi:hypothetical protein
VDCAAGSSKVPAPVAQAKESASRGSESLAVAATSIAPVGATAAAGTGAATETAGQLSGPAATPPQARTRLTNVERPATTSKGRLVPLHEVPVAVVTITFKVSARATGRFKVSDSVASGSLTSSDPETSNS